MSRIVKLLLVLALALPVGAYAVGSLVASAADEPAQREPIVLRDPPARTGSPSPSATPDDLGGTDDDRDDDDDDGPEAVDPSYADLDDDAEDALEDALEDAADEAEDRRDDRRDAAEDRRDDRRDAAEDARDDRDDRDGDDD